MRATLAAAAATPWPLIALLGHAGVLPALRLRAGGRARARLPVSGRAGALDGVPPARVRPRAAGRVPLRAGLRPRGLAGGGPPPGSCCRGFRGRSRAGPAAPVARSAAPCRVRARTSTPAASTGRVKPAAASARSSVAGAKNFRWFGVNPFQSSPFAFSRREFALTVMIRMTPPGASRPRSIRRSSSGIGRWAITDQSVTTSKPPAAISGTSRGRAEVRARAAGPLAGPLDRPLRQVDAPGLEAALVGELHEQPRPAAVVEQPPAASVGEQIAEGVHGDGVALLARAGVAAGEEAVVATLVQLAQPLRPDARMPVQEAARRAADHVVAPAPVAPLGRQQRLHLLLAAQRAADHLLDVAQPDPLRVLGAGQHRGARDPQPPARLVHRGCERQRVRAPAPAASSNRATRRRAARASRIRSRYDTSSCVATRAAADVSCRSRAGPSSRARGTRTRAPRSAGATATAGPPPAPAPPPRRR